MPEVHWKDDHQGIYVELTDAPDGYNLLEYEHLPLYRKLTASGQDLLKSLIPWLRRTPFCIHFEADHGNLIEPIKYRVCLTNTRTGRAILLEPVFNKPAGPTLLATGRVRDPADDNPPLPLLRNPDPPPVEFSCGFDRPEAIPEAAPPESVPCVPHFEPHGHVPGDGVWHAPCAYDDCVSRTRYDALYICAGCRRVRYCSAVCQRHNWRAHRASCQWHAAVDRVAAREGAVVVWRASTPCASVL